MKAIIKVKKIVTNDIESTRSFAYAAYINAPRVNMSMPNEEAISVAIYNELKLSTVVIFSD